MLQGSRAYKKTFIFCRDLETFKLTFKNRKSLNDNSGVRSHVLKLFIKIQKVVVTIETYIMQCKVHILQQKTTGTKKNYFNGKGRHHICYLYRYICEVPFT